MMESLLANVMELFLLRLILIGYKTKIYNVVSKYQNQQGNKHFHGNNVELNRF